MNVEKLTPYQGRRRCYGEYKCLDCNRYWASAYSWANMGQECMMCMKNVYPFKQRKLKRSRTAKKTTPDKAHKEDLCQKCKKSGSACKMFDKGFDKKTIVKN